MRTTLSLDDEVFRKVKQYAQNRSLPLGKAASELIRRGLSAPVSMRKVHGIWVVDLPPDSPRVTTKRVKELAEEW